MHVVVTYGGVLGRLTRWFGFKWSHAALRYVRDESAGARIIESAACGVTERSWEDFVAEAEEYQVFQVKDGLPELAMREIVAYAWGNVSKPYNYWWLLRRSSGKWSSATLWWERSLTGSHLLESDPRLLPLRGGEPGPWP